MDGTRTSLAKELHNVTTVDVECLITDISQLNSEGINVTLNLEQNYRR